MQAAARALALDPESRMAADLVTSLMLEPPAHYPATLRAQLDANDVAEQRQQSRVALGSFAAVLGFLAVAAGSGVQSWTLLGAIAGLSLALAAVAYLGWRREITSRQMLYITCANALLVALMSRMFGSLLIAPAVTCIMALSLTSYPQNIGRPRLVLAILLASWIAPVVLEWAGLIGRTWHVIDGAIVSTSPMFHVGGMPTVAVLVFANLLTIFELGGFAHKLALARRDAQRQLQIQAWHLQQLLPRQS